MKKPTQRDQLLAIENLHESDKIKKALLKKNYGSSVLICRQSEERFAEEVADILPSDEARRVYQTAARNYMALTHAAAALKTTRGSASYRSLAARLGGVNEDKLFENIPSYQELFGGLDYCTCPHCKSIFGPAAYFVDLMRIIDKHIELETSPAAPEKAAPLRGRRGDLFRLPLTCENTNNEKPYLEIVNGIIESYAGDYCGSTDLYRDLSQACYPPALPFRLPAEKLRVWLARSELRLEEILQAWGFSPDAQAAAGMNMGQELFALLQKPLSAEALQRFCGGEPLDLTAMAELPRFLEIMKMNRRELRQILVQDIPDAPENAPLRHSLFLNSGLKDPSAFLDISGDKLCNLTESTLERFVRFTRLVKALKLQSDEADWLFQTAGAGGVIPLAEVWKTVSLARGLSLDIYTAAALTGKIKDYGRGPFYTIFHRTRGELAKLTNPADLQRVLSEELGLEIDALRALCRYLSDIGAVDVDAVYRHCKAAELLKLPMEEYLLLLRLVFPQTMLSVFSAEQLELLFSVRGDSIFTAYELDYIVNGARSPYVSLPFGMEAFRQKLVLLRGSVTDACRANETALAETVCGELAGLCGLDVAEIALLLSCFMSENERMEWFQKAVGDCPVQELEPQAKILSQYLLLRRAGILPELLRAAAEHGDSFGIADPKALTLQSVLDLGRYQQYFTIFDDSEKELLIFLDEYAQSNKNTDTLARVAGWDKAQLAYVAESLYPEGKREPSAAVFVRRAARCMYFVKKLALDEAALHRLLALGGALTYDDACKAADELCQPSMNGEMRAALESAKRDALLPLVLLQLRKSYGDITDYNKLYKYFLIDVEMDDKSRISPVKEGINALQLYLQRCRMRLERGVKRITIPESWWSWVMDYRMWEANRKIFVYPENYLLPSIRHSKTTLFKETEDALQQSKITEGYIEEQYVKYLDNYMELTRLKICGAYETLVDHMNVLYVFARSQQQPYTYHYCKRVSTLAWSEWEKIDTNIDSASITPVFVFNRLHIFWSTLKKSAKVKVESGDGLQADNQTACDLQIKYTYLNLQGKWIAPQTLSQDVVIYAEDDQKSSEQTRKTADAFGIDMADDSFRKLTLLRLTQKNLDGFLNKGADYECLAVMTGSFTQNLGELTGALPPQPTLDREQEAFSQTLNRFIQQNNYEVHNHGDGYFNTGYFKIFNMDMEEEKLLHKKEFFVVDGYLPPNRVFLCTPLHDEIHRAVGVYLSQNVLRDAALPTKGILPFACNTAAFGPQLNENSFVADNASGQQIITPVLSKQIFDKLCDEQIIINKWCASDKSFTDADWARILTGLFPNEPETAKYLPFIKETLAKYAADPQHPALGASAFVRKEEPLIDAALSAKISQKLRAGGAAVSITCVDSLEMANRNLQNIFNDILSSSVGDTQKSNRLLEIQSVLLKNIGAVYLFANADRAEVIPVINQPAKFIYDCGEETFLVYPVYEADGSCNPVWFQKTDAGVAIGPTITIGTFVQLGFDLQRARIILEALQTAGLINQDGIAHMEYCTRGAVGEALKSIVAEETNGALLDSIYVRLRNLPVIAKTELANIAGISVEEICTKLLDKQAAVLYACPDEPDFLRIDLPMLKEKNTVAFTNSKGGVLDDKAAGEIYRRLEAAVSSVNFGYRVNSDLPGEFVELPFCRWRFGVQRLTNPTIKKLKRKLETGGISSFLNRETQSAPPVPIMPFSRLGPTANVVPPKATDGAQIDFEGLYAEYNWELFYHIPMTIADCFKANSMHDQSMRWFHYVFDPTKPRNDEIIKYYWNFLPFAENDDEALENILKNPSALQAYNDSPFDPHAIARLRVGAYGKYTVIEYVHNILEWGDSQFVLNTWESLTTATMMYVWAQDLLGPRPQQVGEVKEQAPRNFDEIDEFYKGEIPQILIDLEKKLQALWAGQPLLPQSDEVPFNDIQAYFGVPENEQFLQLWDVIDDRLYKIRNSLDISGAPRVTALFELPINPAALAKAAAAAGADSPAALTRGAVLYPYRFSYIIAQAKALASQLVQLSAGLLSALEKNDAEALLVLTNSQEQSLLKLTTSIRENQLLELSSNIASLEVSRASAEIRRQFYEENALEYMSAKETAGFEANTAAGIFSAIGGTMSFAAGIAHLVPQVGSPFAMKYGGAEIGSSIAGAAAGYQTLAGVSSFLAQQSLTMAQYDRRRDEWELQKKQAQKDIENIEKQLEGANIRKKCAERELEIHKKNIEHKDEVLRYLKKKFSGAQLYQWLAGKLSSTMWQTYELALELALSAQEAYRYECDESGDFLKYDYWEGSHKGLMAGEGLMLALEQMNQSYQRKNTRRLEIEKNISLRQVCPEALDALKANGVCGFGLSEKLFARDYPAAYRRKITSIALSIPAVLPPYETIKATLKQTRSYILLEADKGGIDFLFGQTPEPPAGAVKEAARHGEKIAVSKGIDDSGMFVLNFSDERYLPFEGTGTASEWLLEMPKENNFFDLGTISDIILSVRYTALEDERRGADSFYDYVTKQLV